MFSLRPATSSDYDYLYGLLNSTMKQYYIETYGKWNDKAELNYFKDSFRNNKYQIISYDGHDVGCLVKINIPNEIFINEIQILPEYQNKGIGSLVLKSIIEESEKLKISIKLDVLKTNIKAQKLYHRFNFKKTEENETHITMIRNPLTINDT